MTLGDRFIEWVSKTKVRPFGNLHDKDNPMPTLKELEERRKKEGRPIEDFLTMDEVDALLKGVTGEADPPETSADDDWAAAMAEQAAVDAEQTRQEYNPWGDSSLLEIIQWEKQKAEVEAEKWAMKFHTLCEIERLVETSAKLNRKMC